MTKKQTPAVRLRAAVGCAVYIMAILCMASCGHKNNEALLLREPDEDITVTEEEKAEYRRMIGTSMDEKRAILILFNTKEECLDFIEKYGRDDKPEESGEGIVPLMENGYYNITGKTALETVFDALKDGEGTRTPIPYSDMFCYIKRIGIVSPLADDAQLTRLIRQEKQAQKEDK